MACSSGAATVAEIALGFAPGYDARTTTVGGTTSGYSLIGSRKSAIAPTRKMTMERTPAKIGRLMKKSEKFMGKAVAGGRGFRAVCWADGWENPRQLLSDSRGGWRGWSGSRPRRA